MAEQSVDHHLDIAAHQSTYTNFVRGAVALGLICAFVLVALCSFAFGHTLNVFVGFAGLIIGIIAVLIDARSGSQRWFLALGVLVIFGLITAISVS
jgi:Bacterial aa3 type cytochrome c oxidase subunit IV